MGDMCKTFEVDNFLVQENGIVRDRDTGLFLFRLDGAARFTWQPIETAPKDGTLVDLWHKEYGRMCDAWWDEAWSCTGTVDGFTHWMPLPAPPAGA